MKDKPTYHELENQIAELQKQNETLRLNFSIQSLEREKRAAELKIANIELEHQSREKKKRAAELKIANIELEHQSGEREKREAELIIANIELEHQSREKKKRSDELKIANIELEHQNEEREKRAAELIIAKIELVFQKEEKAKRAAELIISKIKFAQQSKENEKLAEELIIANLAVALQSELMVAKEKSEENEIKLRELIATKVKLFSIIAHDLRGPFINILTLSELLIEDVKDLDVVESEQYLGMINSTSKNALTLLDNLLNWAQSQTGHIKFNPVTLNLKPIIIEIVDLLNPSAEIKNISLNYDQSIQVELYADENMLKTVLRNLIANGIKFTDTNGKIDVYTLRKQNFIEITVSDNGVGMNQEIRDKLFKIDKNVTTIGTANEKGSGLGLILCKEFVDRHGGRIWIESEEGKGSAFKFSLPLNNS